MMKNKQTSKWRTTCKCCGYRYYYGEAVGYWGQGICERCYLAGCLPALDGCSATEGEQYADVEYGEVASGGWQAEWEEKVGKPLQGGGN